MMTLEQKAERKFQRYQRKMRMIESIKIGSILYDSWGYDQTNVDFYKVLAVKGQRVVIVELGHIDTEHSNMSCKCVADVKQVIGEPIRATISQWGVKLNSSITLKPWDGTPKYKSWYA